ncbi:TIGR04283 family arsenosugar biosynthesis glycosyltransferase [Salinisphaera sp. T31B1]|uniref:TIGR04283 family arsenosugar biosynthesis glycosyltransferase n=1 Tax=Salinisphaera sp. T31B1 TaxID=727963 RepID=UPI003340868A
MVVPSLDEAEALPALLADLAAQRSCDLQIVIADGGSRDATTDIARAAGAQVVVSAPGRGRQMNHGMAATTAPWLCFLHADSRLTHPYQLAHACARLAETGVDCAGHFPLRFDDTRAGRWLYRYMEAKSASGRRRTINGDQGLMISRSFFERLGGFDERQPFLEDQRMAAAIDRHGRWRLFEHRLATSARRFEAEGPRARYLLMGLIMAMHLARVDSFFVRAPGVYARQADTRALSLMAYFRLLYALMRACGPAASLRAAWRIAGVALEQSWQPFFALDTALPAGWRSRGAFTWLHDRLVRPLITHSLGQAVVMAGLVFVIFGPLQLWCALRETARVAR